MTAGITKPGRHRAVGASRRLLTLLSPYRWRMVVIVLSGLLGVATTAIAAPIVLGRATDTVFAGAASAQYPAGTTAEQVIAGLRAAGDTTMADVLSTVDLVPGHGVDFAMLAKLALVLIGLYLAGFVFSWMQERISALVVRRVISELREQVAGKLTRLPLRYFDQQPRGELQSRLTNDVDNLEQGLQKAVGQLMTRLCTVVGVVTMMFFISPLLGGLVLATMPIAGYIATRITRRAEQRYNEQWGATGELNAHIDEAYTAHQLITVLGRRAEAEAVFDERNKRVFTAGLRGEISSGAMEPALLLVNNFGYVIIAVVGALRVVSGSISIGDVQAFAQYNSLFGANAGMLAGLFAELQSGLASARRVFELLDAEDQRPDVVEIPERVPVRGRVEFDRVSFGYDPESRVLNQLSFTIEPGQTVAVVGPTGAGKTTLANLLMRFYELSGGRILVDGVDIATLPREDVRRMTGLVLQDTWLFEGTIADNIAYGREGATREDVIAAARATRVDPFVRTLPGGYDTVLGESAGISAGERQLITVARAFIADPAILIMDEATSSVDTRSEALLQRSMHSLRAGRTSFVIAHRLSTIRDADVIMLLEAGRILERGTHEELLEARGGYARLYHSQTLAP